MPTSVRLNPETEQRLDTLAKDTGRSKAFYIKELIETGLEDLEDYYLAVKIRDRIRSGEEKTYSSEEVTQELGL